MLRVVSAINGFAIEASDGKLGTLSDLLFEEAGWDVRWLVVDAGSWLSGRKVPLPLSVLGHLDLTLRCFSVKPTVQQVKNSPEVDTDHPISRRSEARISNYYGWDPHWVGGNVNISAVAPPFVAPLWSTPRDPVDDGVQPNEDNSDLHSILEVTGYRVRASDGEIGHVDDFLLDDVSWNIRYIVVDTRNWRHGENVLFSSRSVREIDWTNRMIHLDVEREKVKDSPSYDPTITIDRAYEEIFLTYYGIRWEDARNRDRVSKSQPP